MFNDKFLLLHFRFVDWLSAERAEHALICERFLELFIALLVHHVLRMASKHLSLLISFKAHGAYAAFQVIVSLRQVPDDGLSHSISGSDEAAATLKLPRILDLLILESLILALMILESHSHVN